MSKADTTLLGNGHRSISGSLLGWVDQQRRARLSDAEIASQLRRVANNLDRQSFSQEDIWHEQRHLGCTEAQAIQSLTEAEARLDD